MKTWQRLAGSILLVTSVILVGSGLAAYKYWQIQSAMAEPPPPEMPVAVKIAPVDIIKYRLETTIIGTVLAPQSIMLSNEIAGTVAELGFKPGDIVEKDQTLVALDTSVERAELQAAQARVRLTNSTLARMRKAASTDAVTAAEVDEAEAQFDQASAAVAQLQAIIARKSLRAPFRGKIGLCNTHVGQFLPSGFQIASLQSIDDFVNIDFMIPQSAADSVQVGQPVDLVDADTHYSAKIIAIDARADRLSRNLMARAMLTPVPATLVPGDSVRVHIEYGPPLETLSVPAESVRRAPMNTFVYVVERDKDDKERAFARTVRLGKTVGSRVSILEGLKISDRVVADGSFKLHENSLVMDVLLAPPPKSDVK